MKQQFWRPLSGAAEETAQRCFPFLKTRWSSLEVDSTQKKTKKSFIKHGIFRVISPHTTDFFLWGISKGFGKLQVLTPTFSRLGKILFFLPRKLLLDFPLNFFSASLGDNLKKNKINSTAISFPEWVEFSQLELLWVWFEHGASVEKIIYLSEVTRSLRIMVKENSDIGLWEQELETVTVTWVKNDDYLVELFKNIEFVLSF